MARIGPHPSAYSKASCCSEARKIDPYRATMLPTPPSPMIVMSPPAEGSFGLSNLLLHADTLLSLSSCPTHPRSSAPGVRSRDRWRFWFPGTVPAAPRSSEGRPDVAGTCLASAWIDFLVLLGRLAVVVIVSVIPAIGGGIVVFLLLDLRQPFRGNCLSRWM